MADQDHPFMVKLVCDGGEDGSAIAPATWTYSAYSLDGKTLGEKIQPVRKRANGRVRPGGEFGIAFVRDGRLLLWDAGETPRTC